MYRGVVWVGDRSNKTLYGGACCVPNTAKYEAAIVKRPVLPP